MADYLSPSENDAPNLQVLSVLSDLRFSMPGIVEEFDAETNLVKVTPAIKAKISVDGKVEYKKLPLILKVPVVIPCAQNAGLCLTIPIKKGDDCLLIFSDRMIDNFVKDGTVNGPVSPECCGGDNKTSEPRMHHLTDAVCIPGILSIPTKIPNWNPEHMELRTKDGKNFIRVGSGGYGIRLTSGGGFDNEGADIRMQGGQIWFYGAEKIITRTRINRREHPPEATGEDGEPTMPE